uniref:MotA/TolQ/ExbB proton channel family protein n=1 Tax=Roseihalotalea indica TaxID=2867963 RepID=A0AA49GK48_9BACT|nr:MotA/TolQ/ExbB proton channel family protein [Tunicatimonas sp. TK19036]
MKTSVHFFNNLKTVFAATVIPLEIVLAILLYVYVLGNPENFQGGDPANHPMPGNYLGIIYKGGFIVPILLALLMMVLTFAAERLFTIARARGRGNVKDFVRAVKRHLSAGDLYQAIHLCDRQKGSVANVVRAGLLKYEEMKDSIHLDQDRKILAIRKDIEETTQLEMPMLEKNLVIISTIASIATLMGLLGTVLGMIKAFAALATAGAPDAVALANGISEALINTALGIGTSALAIIFYNYFTSKIDTLTYSIDEAAYSIVQNFAATRTSETQKIAS